MTEIIKDGINWQIEHDDEFIKQVITAEDCKDRIKLRAVSLPLDKGTCTVTCVIDDREVNLRALFPGVYNPIMEFCPIDVWGAVNEGDYTEYVSILKQNDAKYIIINPTRTETMIQIFFNEDYENYPVIGNIENKTKK